jgi:hypothetical protein
MKAIGGYPLQGDKSANGTYVVYVRTEGMLAERMFATYIDGTWTHPFSDQRFRHEILGRVGPLPPLMMDNWK